MIPYGRQTIDLDDKAAVMAALGEPFLTTGPLVEAYEEAFARAVGARYAVACNSGTAALHLAYMALGIGPGDCMVVPAITFVATANAVRMTGADVVFADVDPETGLMTSSTLLNAEFLGRTKATVPVHLNGDKCLVSGWVYDASHALGMPNIGRYGLTCFSTHPVKAITTCEGGVVTTEDASQAELMRELRSHGLGPNHTMTRLGWNYRIPDVLCALGLSQLKKLPQFMDARWAIARLYDSLLEPLAPWLRPVPHALRKERHANHLYPVLIESFRDDVMSELLGLGIRTQVHYRPVDAQPYYRGLYGEPKTTGAQAYAARCLSLPIYPTMTSIDVVKVVDALKALSYRYDRKVTDEAVRDQRASSKPAGAPVRDRRDRG